MADVANRADTSSDNSPIGKFLTPESMLTPGATGGFVMLISNALSHNFSLSPLYTSYLGMGLSFVFGLLIINKSMAWWTKLVYYFLNSLIIFCVAFGSGTLVGPGGTAHAALTLFPSAYAAETTKLDQLKADYAQLSVQYDRELEKLNDLQRDKAPQTAIDNQVSVLSTIQAKKNANLDMQFAEVKRGAVLGNSNSVANNPSPVFRAWANPFKF